MQQDINQVPALPALPATTALPRGGLSQPSAMWSDGADGTPKNVWARYKGFGFAGLGANTLTANWGYGSGAYSAGAGGYANIAHINRGSSAVVAQELYVSNPLVKTLVDTLTTYALGPSGLTLSAKPVANALGMTEEQARALAHQLETRFAVWSKTPSECDATGRNTLTEIAAICYQSWLMTGEALVAFDWSRARGGRAYTKVCALSPWLIEPRTEEGASGLKVFQGAAFHFGKFVGLYLRRPEMGSSVSQAPGKFYPLETSFGRRKLALVFDSVTPMQCRGASPILQVLSTAQERALLQEVTLVGAALQNSFSVSIESALPNKTAFDGLSVDDRASGGYGANLTASLQERADFYTESPIQITNGVVNHLLPGEKLTMHKPQAITAHFADFDAGLVRTVARAGGVLAEDLSGDWSGTSYSASKLALATPWTLNQRRRETILARVYQMAYEAFVEEILASGEIELPEGAADFWSNRAAYCHATWRGSPRPSADPLKDSLYLEKMLQLGLLTYEDALATLGADLETTIAQRRREKELLEEAGLVGASIFGGTIQIRENVDNPPLEEDERDRRKPQPSPPAEEDDLTEGF